VTVLPEPETEIWTGTPGIGLPCASRTVTVIVDDPLPAWNDVGSAERVDREGSGVGGGGGGGGGGAAVTVTVAVCWIATPPALADTVLVPASVDVNEPVATPLALVDPG
jgi:hypothetical protein